MSAYSDLWQVITLKVCQNSNTPVAATYGMNNYVGSKIKLRVLQIFTLEVILGEYRREDGTPFMPLEGEKALHHMIFEKTKWPLHAIRDLPLNDALFIINEQLRITNLPANALDFVEKLNLGLVVYSVDEFSKEDWDPKENSVFLQDQI